MIHFLEAVIFGGILAYATYRFIRWLITAGAEAEIADIQGSDQSRKTQE